MLKTQRQAVPQGTLASEPRITSLFQVSETSVSKKVRSILKTAKVVISPPQTHAYNYIHVYKHTYFKNFKNGLGYPYNERKYVN